MNTIKEYFKNLNFIIRKPEMKILPGHLAFFLFLSIVPIITLIVYFGMIFSIGTDSVLDLVNRLFPEDIAILLQPYVNDMGIDIHTIIFMITGFVVASNGPHSIIITSNTLFHIQHADYLKRRIKAFFLTILLLFLFLFTLIFLAFGNSIFQFLISLEVLQSFESQIYFIYLLIKWPIAFFLFFFIIKLIYTWAPDERVPSHYATRGAIFTTVGWSLVSVVYSYYVINFKSENIFYGALSNIIVIMMWVYILAYILVIGIAINTSDYHLDQETMQGKTNNKEKNGHTEIVHS